ncbi:MAG TPA: hypothetical protein VMA30_20280 [Xanthobacteraceae bacterium]|nr:hypothetical protein [Xanthobacteraceae bacterium]
MSSPIDLDKNLDPVLQYAPRWARENAVRPEEPWEVVPAPERLEEPALSERSGFSGDRAAHELFRQLALHPTKVPEPIVDESHSLRPLMLRIGAIIAVAAGIAGVIVVLPGAKQNTRAPQPSDISAGPQPGPQYASQSTSSGTQSSSHPVKLVPVEATEGPTAPAASNATAVASASNKDVPASPPPAEDVHPVVAQAHAAAAYVAQRDTAAVPAAKVDQAPVQIPSPTAAAPQKSQDAPAQTAATEPPASQKDASEGRTLDHKEIATLVDQAETLVRSGDLSGARVLLQRAAEAGDANAALELAGTFDPKVLRELGAIGIAADPARARKWYERAAALGSIAATKKLAEFAN